jgi:hypothetical protein
MIRILIIGYVFAIRSQRALCRDVRVNLAYRWFCGLSIEDKIPDHSAFSRARNERFRDSGIFRSVFERVVGACIGAGLVGGEGFAVDASLIVADANKQRSTPGPQWNKELDAEAVSRATKEYLARSGTFTSVRPARFSPQLARWPPMGDTILPGQDTRLPQLSPQGALLSKGAVAQNPAQHLRGGP